MALKDILTRPSSSGGNKKRSSTREPAPALPITSPSKSSQSPRKNHSKIGSLHRLSLSFHRNSLSNETSFGQYLTQEPGEISRKNSLAVGDADPLSRPGTSTTPKDEIEQSQSSSGPLLRKTVEEEEQRIEEEVTPKPQRFSLMKFKHASEPQLSTRFKEKESTTDIETAPSPPPPRIITTAPTQQLDERPPKKKERLLPRTFNSFRKSMIIREDGLYQSSHLSSVQNNDGTASSSPNLIRAMSQHSPWKNNVDVLSPPAYGDEGNSMLATPVPRISESGGSEGSSGSHRLYAQTTTTRITETTTTIFKLKPNKKKKSKDKGPLFPLPERLPHPGSGRTSISNANDSNDAFATQRSTSPSRRSTQGIRWRTNVDRDNTPVQSPAASATALTNAPLGSPGPSISRMQSSVSVNSGDTTPTSSLAPPRLGARGRSSTMGSLGRSSDRYGDIPPSSRNSTSTTGRRSFGDILTQRLRKDSAPVRHGSGSGSTPGSKSNSFQLAREPEPELTYPRREEEDTPATYLERLEAAVPRGDMATVLCKGADDFSKTCLRKYMRGFSYFGESIDFSIRKMLMEVILPKETQQIDRLLAGFADRYHECNPGIFTNADEANFLAFSILLLQSDNHNKNNKRKMTKTDYIKNTQNGRISVAEDVLECFYDNICYTPFIHFDDEVAVNNHRLTVPRRRTGLRRAKSSEMLRGPVDPYTLILDNKLEALRPSLKDVIETEDSYSTAPVDSNDNHRAFVHAAVIQIVSARSRPDAFTNQATITNPAEAQVGLVSIKVAKVGLLWRKSTKKKKAKSPWQEWGVILTDTKLYFFRDVGWAKKLVAQYEGHTRTSSRNMPLVFKPPLTSFDPDAWMSLEDAVALLDSSYKRHKNAFTFIKHGGFEEVFLANSEVDTVDWISKLNYAATFRTAGVRMQGLLGTNYEGRNLFRKDSEISIRTDTSHTTDRQPSAAGKTDPQLAWEIMFYRRQLVSEKISALDDHVANAQKELDYLLRNARHLLVLLPVQQKTREGVVYAAGRMNAKLKWTRREIWRARTHRDILIKDLEAEATQAFPAPLTRTPAVNTPAKTTPTKTNKDALVRSETDQTLRSNVTRSSAVTTPASASARRRPSQTILEQISTSTEEPPEMSQLRRRSANSILSMSPKPSPRYNEDITSEGRDGTPSIRTSHSRRYSAGGDSQAATDIDAEDFLGSPHTGIDGTFEHRFQRGSESEHDRPTRPQPLHLVESPKSPKERTSSVRRSLHRTLRDASGNHSINMRVPHHARSQKGKDSGSSFAATDDNRSFMSGESEELKRDPTGRFVLHGKKASVITMSPEWQLSSEDRIKLREQLLKEQASEDASKQLEDTRAHLHVDTSMIDAGRKSVDGERSMTGGDVSPTTCEVREVDEEDRDEQFHSADLPKDSRRNTADSNRFSAYSAVTAPTGHGETFHSAESSPRVLYKYNQGSAEDQDPKQQHSRKPTAEAEDSAEDDENDSESEVDEHEEPTFVVRDFDGLGIVRKPNTQELDGGT
ncbi:hypothetical protein LTR51_001488 [Lithohypha guttulata]|nr:hypothetical protein LTR51_001488 [Lithohypha guttulata]